MDRKQLLMDYSLDNNDPEHGALIQDLYEKWSEWDEVAFGKVFSKSNEFVSFGIEHIEEEGGLAKFGYPADRRKWRYTKITLSQAVLTGEQKDFQEGPEYRSGRILFLYDLMLHEMIHHFIEMIQSQAIPIGVSHQDILFDYERSKQMASNYPYADLRHGVVFTKKANEVAQKLQLPLVGCLCPSGELKQIDFGGRLSKFFPMCCKSKKAYDGAYIGTEYCLE